MANTVPIYRSPGRLYKADTCQPLVQAVEARKIQLEALVHGHYPGRRLPAGALPGLKTVGFWDAAEDQDWGLPWHRNEGIELTFLERGTAGFDVEQDTCLLHPDDLTVTRPWQRHRVGTPNVLAGRLHWLILDVGVRRPNQSWRWPAWLLLSHSDLRELTEILRQTDQPVWKTSADVRRCFQSIATTVKTDRGGSNLSKLAVKVNELFVLLLDLFRRHEIVLDESLTSSRRTVELFLADLSQHPEHLALDWSIHEMARSCGLGVTQFIHHVRLIANVTPAQYVNRCRLDLAARLLRNGRVSVTDVALECGFSSSQYFATVFQRRYGCTPREFRAARA
jgi:AraC family L-rhamnose operon regulatory protein RhaS